MSSSVRPRFASPTPARSPLRRVASLFALAASLACASLLAPSFARAQGCATCVPLNDLAGPVYRSRVPGLYAGGGNAPPVAHAALALSEAALVKPRDASGAISPGGLIGFLSIGMSNTNQEFAAYELMDDGRIGRNPRLVLVNGAVGGQSADVIVNPLAPYWSTVNLRVTTAGLTPAQIQVVWLKEAEGAVPDSSFPAAADTLRAHLRSIVRDLKDRFPNLRLCYLSSRTYGGWNSAPDRGEPLSYETAFAYRDLIEEQSSGSAALNTDPDVGPVEAPVLLWGPYLWARGTTPRASDGLTWQLSDVEPDHVHPAASGETKAALQLTHFIAAEPTAAPWKDAVTGETCQVLGAIADAWVADGAPNTNNGLDSVIVWSNPATRGYVKFDLSPVTGALLHAKLSLKLPADLVTNRVDVVAIANNAWTETGITAANAPAFNGVTLATIPPASRGGTLSADVTSAVQAALASGPGAQLTLGLRTLFGGSAPQFVRSRETGEGPRLVLSMLASTNAAPALAAPSVLRLSPGTQPFAGRGEVVCALAERAARFELDVLDAQGRRVRVLADGARDAGTHRFAWDGRDAHGGTAPAGVYVVQARATGASGRVQQAATKVVLVRR